MFKPSDYNITELEDIGASLRERVRDAAKELEAMEPELAKAKANLNKLKRFEEVVYYENMPPKEKGKTVPELEQEATLSLGYRQHLETISEAEDVYLKLEGKKAILERQHRDLIDDGEYVKSIILKRYGSS